MKKIFEDYTGGLTNYEKLKLIERLKKKKYSKGIFFSEILATLILSIKMEEEAVIADVMNILEAEPSSDTDHREQLALLVASWNAKERTGEVL